MLANDPTVFAVSAGVSADRWYPTAVYVNPPGYEKIASDHGWSSGAVPFDRDGIITGSGEVTVTGDAGRIQFDYSNRQSYAHPGGRPFFGNFTHVSSDVRAYVEGPPGTPFTARSTFDVTQVSLVNPISGTQGSANYVGLFRTLVPTSNTYEWSGVSNNASVIEIDGKTYSSVPHPNQYESHHSIRIETRFANTGPRYPEGDYPISVAARFTLEVNAKLPTLEVSGDWQFGTIDEPTQSTVTFTNAGPADSAITVTIAPPPDRPLPRGQIFALVEAGDVTFTLAGGESRDVELIAMVDSATPFGTHKEVITFDAAGAKPAGGAIEATASVPKPTAETLPFGFYQRREILPKFKITRALENVSIRLRNAGEPEGTGERFHSEYYHPSDVREAIARGEVPTYALPLNGRGGSYVIELAGDARKVDGTSERVYATWDLSIEQGVALGAATETVVGFDRPGLAFEPEDVLKYIFSKGKEPQAPIAEGTMIWLGISLKAIGTVLRFEGPVEAGVSRQHQLLRRVDASFDEIDGFSITPVSVYRLAHRRGVGLTSLQGSVRLKSGDAVDWQDDVYLSGTTSKSYSHSFGEPRWLLPGQTLEFSATAWTSVFEPRLPSPSGDVLTALPVGGGFSSRPELDGPQITFGGGAAGPRLPWRPGVKRVR